MALKPMKSFLLLLVSLAEAAGAHVPTFYSVGGNASFTVRDEGKTVMAWVSVAHARNQSGNLSVAEPLLYIENFQLVDVSWGSALTAFDVSAHRLFLLGEKPRAHVLNETVGEMILAVVDTSAKPSLLHIQHSLPIVNMWRQIPLDDSDGHACFIQTWGRKLVLAGPTAEKASFGFDLNFTVFVLDPESFDVESRFKIPLDFAEIAQGPAQLDSTTSVLHFLVDRVYAGQRIYHLSLPSGALRYNDVPEYYWSTFVHVPAAGALFGPAQINTEMHQTRYQGQAKARKLQNKASSEVSWRWARYDLGSGTFSNSSLAGITCIPITNPEDNTQNIAGVLPESTSRVYVGMTCQPDAGTINAYLAIVDYRTAIVEGLWTFAGLYYPESAKGLLYFGEEQSKNLLLWV